MRSRAAWRRWLAKNHATASEVWLIFHKRHTGVPSVAYDAAVEEALCFGWVDSLIKRLDEDRYARKFTPRKADSAWSPANRRRYAQLRAAGRLAAAGLMRVPTGRSSYPPPPPASGVPAYIARAFRKEPGAWKVFQALAPSHRRRYVWWIDSAKQDATRQRRIQEALRMLAGGKTLGLR